jgi:bifunctional DNA-binding transcriptional regulator/antitoxin component of YhaV-PrlF toxin-antitoxin module
MMARAKNIVAATPNGDITTEMILGYLALVSIPNKPVSTAKLKKVWLVHGQDEKLVPKARRSVDVFMAACRSVESRRTDEDRVHEIKVDRVLESSEECIYQVTVLVRNKDLKLIDHPKGMRLTFTAKDGKIKEEPLDDKKTYKEVKQLATVIREEFDRNSSKVPGSKVRGAIRETLIREHATRVQNKGVFFVPKAARRTLSDLQGVIADLYGDGSDAEMVVLPVASDKAEKAMVKRHYEENVVDEIDSLLTEIVNRLKSDNPVRGDRKANMVSQRKHISEGLERYQDLLDERSITVAEKMKLLDNGLEELLIGSE